MKKEGGTRIGNFLRAIVKLFKSLTARTRELTPEIIQVVENIKKFVDSPGADFLTAVIPGTLDDWAKNVLRIYIPHLLLILNTVKELSDIVDENERNKAIVAHFQTSETDTKEMFLHSLAAKLVQKTTDNQWSESVVLAESVYKNPEILNA